MSEKEKMVPMTIEDAEEKEPDVIQLSKTYLLDGKSVTELDLAGLNDLTAMDMIDANKYLTREGIVTSAPELTMAYACFIAARATKMPVEFFELLNMKDAIRVKSKVTGFIYGQD